jgi:Concanavalin A-like lectin/glucanases superfamily/Bacterial Ig-like domain
VTKGRDLTPLTFLRNSGDVESAVLRLYASSFEHFHGGRAMRKVLGGLACLLWAVTLIGCGGVSSGGTPPLTPAQDVAAAKAALAIGYASGDSASSVTQNLTLPTSGLDGTAVSWASSNTAVVSNAGVVTQPDTQDASVTLTATISVSGASDTKAFPIVVKAKMTDAQAVAAAKAALAIGYASGDSASSVTQNLTLPATGIDGSNNSWVSNNTSVISNAGVVTRPTTGDASVTITATITVGSSSDTKAFPVTVKAQMTDAQAVAAAKAALAIGYASGDSASSVTQSLTLPATGIDNSTVTWVSSSPTVVSNSGAVTQPLTQDASLTMTATITVGSASDTKAFPLTVKAQMTDAQAVAAAKAALAIGYASGDSASSVTQNVTLPSTGIDNSTNTWVSSNQAVVSNAGAVTQPLTQDASVTMTATITVGSASDTKAFPITVKASVTDVQAVAAEKAALGIGYASGDSASSVTQNVTLASSGMDGTSVTWISSNPSVSNTGVVTRPLTGNTEVTLTATIARGSASDTKAFLLVVIPQLTDAQAVAAAKAALTIGYASGDSASSVTQNLTLTTTGIDNTQVSWSSNNAAVVSTAGVVTRPATGDASVTLTATISLRSNSDTQTFPITVKATMTDAQAVAAAKAALAIGYASGDSASSVTHNLTLPTTGIDSSTITWASSDLDFISNSGVVWQPLTQDANVTLTATITVGSASDTEGFPVTVKAQMTDAQAVAAAKAALAIGYASGDFASSVTQNLTLPSTGIDTSTITWASSNAAVVGNDGTVTQPLTQDANVTLTATITVGSASDTKAFPITVKAQMTDAQAVAAAKAALAIGYQPGDGPDTVTRNLTLTTSGLDNCTVSWASSDPSIAPDGTVTQPVTGDLPVTLTATITSNAVSDTKDFIVTVKAQMSDEDAVAAAKAALAITYAQGDAPTSVTQNVSLPLSGSDNCTISWSSDTPAVISNTGVVGQPSVGNVQVTLTATITSHAYSDTASFTLTVLGQVSDQDAVAAAKAALNIIYASGDSASSVTQNVTLPASGADATTVTWASDTPSVIGIDGTVTQPQSDPVVVTLTATITSHSYSDTDPFLLTVQPALSDAARVAADKAALTIGFGPGDRASIVTGNISLPTSGTNGSTITWSSSDTSVISNSGGVTVPTDTDADVTMTATLTYNSASDTDEFPLTVRATLSSSWVDATQISPGNGAIEVDPGIVVRIPFQRALDVTTVTTDNFQIIQTNNSQNIPINVTYDGDSQTVSLQPQSPLSQDTEYSVAIAAGLKDASEKHPPNDMSFDFTTLTYADILAQWKFNGDGTDASSNGNALNNITGIFDTDVVHEGSASLYLNGAGQNGTSNIDLGTQLTVAVWVNVDNPIQFSINTIMSNVDTQEESNGFKLCINHWMTSDESVVIEVGDGNTGGKWITQTGLIIPGSWYHLAFVIDQPNQSLRVYYNGAPAPLSFTSDEGFTLQQFDYNFNTSGPFTIGSFPSGAYGFKGHLDDMRVYNRVLSDAEIAKIAQEK